MTSELLIDSTLPLRVSGLIHHLLCLAGWHKQKRLCAV